MLFLLLRQFYHIHFDLFLFLWQVQQNLDLLKIKVCVFLDFLELMKDGVVADYIEEAVVDFLEVGMVKD